jgi:hypothetical protein
LTARTSIWKCVSISSCRLFASGAFTSVHDQRTAIVTYLPAVALAAVTEHRRETWRSYW